MSDPRERALAVMHCRYTIHPDTSDGVCMYCGAPADTVDHVPPVSVAFTVSAVEAASLTLRLVHCCRECNSTLGASGGKTIEDRRLYLARKYRIKYRGLLEMPKWYDDDMDDLGPTLRQYIRRSADSSRFLRARMHRLLGRPFYRTPQGEVVEASRCG